MTTVMQKNEDCSRPYFALNIFIPPSTNLCLRDKYRKARDKHNEVALSYIFRTTEHVHFDAGFDIFCPSSVTVKGGESVLLNQDIKCSMLKVEAGAAPNDPPWAGLSGLEMGNRCLPVGYYLYPRSSMGTKTPLRLSNSVGIVDSGYRGNIMAALDNRSKESYYIEQETRLLQICPPDLSYPTLVRLVENESDLGETARGDGGFGSTGK
jgi:hypothetical protein